MGPLKKIKQFLRSLESPLINFEISFILNWPENCVIVSTNVANQRATFLITDTKLYFPVVTLSTKDNAKLLQELKSSFKRIINWNKCQSTARITRTKPIFKLII